MKNWIIIIISFFTFSCQDSQNENKSPLISETSIVILGNIQDAGSPHMACKKSCCENLFLNPDKNRKVVSIGLIDQKNQKTYLFDASPDFTEQTKALKQNCNFEANEVPNGIFLTHAHIGHYTGLMYLGKEAMNANNAIVYCMPKMTNFLKNNGPWSQLVKNKNIHLNTLQHDSLLKLSTEISVIPMLVPHRDEYSETVGYKIIGPNKSALFIPDIDKWERWNRDIIEEIKAVDYAFLDATFYDGNEINNRDISEIPHPFVIETMDKFESLELTEKNKIFFIHLNHTNPLINENSEATKLVLDNGYNVGRINTKFSL